MNNQRPEEFWRERFKQFGHTGTADRIIHGYDQSRRLESVRRALNRAGVKIGRDTRILDIGCGTGDFISFFLSRGAVKITGIDFVGELIIETRKRFREYPEVQLLPMTLPELDFPLESFDLISAINVLQHLTGEEEFGRGILNILKVLKTGGYLLTMDFSDFHPAEREPSPQIAFRTRDHYIRAVESRSAKLRGEFGLPRIGVRSFLSFRSIFDRPIKAFTGRYYFPAINVLKRGILALARPWDYLCFPFPAALTDMRILIFQKT